MAGAMGSCFVHETHVVAMYHYRESERMALSQWVGGYELRLLTLKL